MYTAWLSLLHNAGTPLSFMNSATQPLQQITEFGSILL